jgi:superfamily II DNA/RNA helicase
METGKFSVLGVDRFFEERLAQRGIDNPTAIQKKTIPVLLEGKSVLFRSATGTGKTFAYLIPALHQLLYAIENHPPPPYRSPALLICAPTFELCSQIKQELDFLLSQKSALCPSALLIGSVNISRQIETLKKSKPLAVVGSPGRLLALAQMGKLKLGGIKFLALDEADRMTADESLEEMGMLLNLIARSSEGLTAAACSATLDAKQRERLLPLLKKFCAGDFQIIESEEHEILREKIEHWAIFSESRRKTQTLRSFLAAARPKKALVFAARADDAYVILSQLQHHHIGAAGLIGGQDKRGRKVAVDSFRSGKTAVLVATDLAARGLDIPGISHIIALDVPVNGDAYIHRAGRTGRAGKRGIMVTIGDEMEMRRLAALEKKLKITVHPKELYEGRVCKPELPLDYEAP